MKETKKKNTRSDRPFLTPRDKYLIQYAADQTILRVDQLQRLMARFRFPDKQTKQEGMVSEQSALRRIKAWVKKGMATYERVFTQEPGYFWLTSHGLNHCLQEYTYMRPTRGKYTHFRLVTEVRMSLEQRHGQAISVRSERLLRKIYHVAKGAVSKNNESGLKPHIADLEIIKRENGGVAAIEVELSLKGKKRLQDILSELAERYTTIYYYCVPKTEAFVKEQIATLPEPAKEQFEVRDLLPLAPDLQQNPFVW